MAVTSAVVDSATRSSSSGTSPSITGIPFGTAFAGRVICILAVFSDTVTPTSGTIGGATATFSGGVDVGGFKMYIVSAVVPTGISGTLQINFSGGSAAIFTDGAVALTGAASATPTATYSSNSIPGTINVPAGGSMLAYMGSATGSPGTWTGANELIALNANSDSVASLDNSGGALTGHSVSYTGAGGLVLASFAAASGGTAYTLSAAEGTFAFNGKAATLNRGRNLAAAQGSFSLAGKAATPNATRSIAAARGLFALTGEAVTFNRGIRLTAAQGSFILNGRAATLPRAIKMAAAQGAFSLNGEPAGLPIGRSLNAGQGSFVLSGKAATFPIGVSIKAAQGSFSLNGMGAALVYTPASGGGGIPHSNPFIATPGPMTSLP